MLYLEEEKNAYFDQTVLLYDKQIGRGISCKQWLVMGGKILKCKVFFANHFQNINLEINNAARAFLPQ
jgi:hypothetical protein